MKDSAEGQSAFRLATSELAQARGSAELPAQDGYFWMKNITDDDYPELRQEHWRIVRVGIFNTGESRSLIRSVRDGQNVYTLGYLRTWTGVEFHGPLHPPNAQICHADPTSGVTTKKTANGSALASSKG